MGFLKFYFLIMGWFLDLKLKRVAIAGGWGGIIVIVRLTVVYMQLLPTVCLVGVDQIWARRPRRGRGRGGTGRRNGLKVRFFRGSTPLAPSPFDVFGL
jgi:hypothetical protein